MEDNSDTVGVAVVCEKLIGLAELDGDLLEELIDRLIALERRVAIIEAEAQPRRSYAGPL